MRARELLTLPAAVALALVLWGALRTLGPIALWLGAWFVWWPCRKQAIGRTLRNLLVLFLALRILYQARWVVYPIVGGVLLAYVLSPTVDWLARRRVRRPLAVFLSLLPSGAVTALAFVLLVPAVVGQMSEVIQRLPSAYEQVEKTLRPTLERTGLIPRGQAARPSGAGGGLSAAPASDAGDSATAAIALPSAPESASVLSSSAPPETAAVEAESSAAGRAAVPGHPGEGPTTQTPATPSWLRAIVSHAESVLRTAASGISGVGKGVGRALRWLGVILLMPFIAFYLLVDWHRIGDGLLSWIPAPRHALARRLSGELRVSLSIFLRGQLIVAGIEAVLFSVLYRIAGLSDPIALGVLSGLFSLIPFLGFAGTILLVLLTGITGPHPLAVLIKAGIGLGVINFLEGQVLTPRIQGSGFGLPPLAVIMGVLFFGTLFGFVGVFLAVPAMAIAKGYLPEIRRAWESRVLQTGESPRVADDEPG